MIQSPCKDCDNRSYNCHSECKLYNDYKETHEKEISDIRKAKDNERIVRGFPR